MLEKRFDAPPLWTNIPTMVHEMNVGLGCEVDEFLDAHRDLVMDHHQQAATAAIKAYGQALLTW